MAEDFERFHRFVQARDPRYDGWFVVGVTSTGIFCRPSCPARTPKRENMRFFDTAAAARSAGFRACKRCRPDAAPGSPAWNTRADVAGRAMRLIADGVVDRDGVGGLAARVGYSERQLQRVLVDEVGAGPLALARAHRAQTARTLIERSELPFSDVASASGFGSVRQFNEAVRELFATTPTELRRRSHRRAPSDPGAGVELRLGFRAPLDGPALLRYLALRSVPGIEEGDADRYRRVLRLDHGAGVIEIELGEREARCRLRLDDLRDLAAAAARTRRLLDLDADPVGIAALLGEDDFLGPLVRARPGLRVPGHGDGWELALRTVVGQQVSVAGARTVTGRLVERFGTPLAAPDGGLTHRFPEPAAMAEADPARLGMPRSRGATIVELARRIAAGDLVVDAGADPAELGEGLLAIRGIGPWTASYVRMRVLGDPDVFLATDLGVRRALARLGCQDAPAIDERWRPWRSYAVAQLWASLADGSPA